MILDKYIRSKENSLFLTLINIRGGVHKSYSYLIRGLVPLYIYIYVYFSNNYIDAHSRNTSLWNIFTKPASCGKVSIYTTNTIIKLKQKK